MGRMSHVTTERRFVHVLASQLPLLPGRGDLEGHIQDASDQLKYLAFVVSLDLCSSFLTSTTAPESRQTSSTRPPQHPPRCPSDFRNTAVPNKSGHEELFEAHPAADAPVVQLRKLTGGLWKLIACVGSVASTTVGPQDSFILR